jgi:multiple sugar transport system permease protein
VVTALLWSWLLQPQYGVLNWLLSNTGLQSNLNQLWTQDPKLAMPSVIIACVWRQTPYMMVMLLAGLQSVSHELLEAASIDGAGYWQTFRNVTLPSIRPVLDTSITVAIINNAQMFTIIYNMTAGGPLRLTTTFSVGAYLKAFSSYDFGQGSALGMIWLVILTVVIFLYKRHSEKKINEYL